MIKRIKLKVASAIEKVVNVNIKIWNLVKENQAIFSNWSENAIWVAALLSLSLFLAFMLTVHELIQNWVKPPFFKKFLTIASILVGSFETLQILKLLRHKIRELIELREVDRIEG